MLDLLLLDDVLIRPEIRSDHAEISCVLKGAFGDNTEDDFVKFVRDSEFYIPELTVVAMFKNRVIGQLTLSKVFIENEVEKQNSLVLAPLSVHPKFQGIGISRMMLDYALNKAMQMNYTSVISLGNLKYFKKMGFSELSDSNIELDTKGTDLELGIIPLKEGALKKLKGKVKYPKELLKVY